MSKRISAVMIIGILCLSSFSLLTLASDKAHASATNTVGFNESGASPSENGWSVTLNGVTEYSTPAAYGGIEFDNVPVGIIPFAVTPPSGFSTSPCSGSVPVHDGSSWSLQIYFESTPSNQPLSATFMDLPANLPDPLAWWFIGRTSGGSWPYSYSYSFGDGSSSNQDCPVHTYQNAGSYLVTLTVTDSTANTATSSVTIIVGTKATLSALASANPTSGNAPLSVQFTGSASGGSPPYTYDWIFSDGINSNLQNPSHTYQNVGSYLVTLTVTDSTANTATSSATVTVKRATYIVAFTGTGLPKGTQWSVEFNSKAYSSTTNQIVLEAANDVYSFTVPVMPDGYTASPLSGEIAVKDKGATELITFVQLGSFKGISNTITGVTSLRPQPDSGFAIQQNFYMFTGLKDSDGIHPLVYWCQNVLEIKGTIQYAKWWIWKYSLSTGQKTQQSYSFSAPFNYLPDKIQFISEITNTVLGPALYMSTGLFAAYTFFGNDPRAPFTNDAYISTSESESGTALTRPNLVIVGPSAGGQADFVEGSGQVSCRAEVGSTWNDALNLNLVLFGSATGETSTGLAWPTAQGYPTGGFYNQSGLPLYSEGIFFEPDFSKTSGSCLTVTAQCPVYLDLYDELGNCVGYNATSEVVENQIDNAVWESNQTILVFNPSGIYSLVVTGTEDGTFSLGVCWQDPCGVAFVIKDVNGTILKNAQQAYAVGATANAIVTNVTAKTVVGLGLNLQVNTTVSDIGGPNATCDFILRANDTIIGTQSALNLSGWNSATASFTWNTTGIAYGNYTLWAYATNNNCTGGMVTVSIPGDINGDFQVKLADIVILANAYGTQPNANPTGTGSHQWNPNADIDGNNVVGLSDLVILAQHYGQHYP